jgi:hypothetical protein
MPRSPVLREREKTPTSFRLTTRALRLLEELTVRTGIGRSACLEVAIREIAKREGIGSMTLYEDPVWSEYWICMNLRWFPAVTPCSR